MRKGERGTTHPKQSLPVLFPKLRVGESQNKVGLTLKTDGDLQTCCLPETHEETDWNVIKLYVYIDTHTHIHSYICES